MAGAGGGAGQRLREFVKWAHATWGTAWLLVGGDTEIVPVRTVVGFVGGFSLAASDPPEPGGAHWTGTFLKVRIDTFLNRFAGPFFLKLGLSVSGDTALLRASDGDRIPYDATGSSSSTQAGCYFTDSTYANRATMATEYVRVNGPAAQVNTELFWLTDDNLISTDLYYADVAGYPKRSPYGTLVPFEGGVSRSCSGHDWDQINNQLYGQWSSVGDLDGVRYQADLSVGRAPVGSGAEAKTFVDKVIWYDQQSGLSLSAEWFPSCWWCRRTGMCAAATTQPPPSPTTTISSARPTRTP